MAIGGDGRRQLRSVSRSPSVGSILLTTHCTGGFGLLQDRRILLIISGGIAAYKSLELIRRLRERGAAVRCIMTAASQNVWTPQS